MWEEVTRRVKAAGGEVHMRHKVVGLTVAGDRVASATVRDEATGETRVVEADYVFSTMPVKDLIAAIDDEVPEAVALPAPAALVVWRKGFQPHFRTLDATEAALVRHLHIGLSVHDACTALPEQGLWAGDATELSQWLAQLLGEGLVRAVRTHVPKA